MYSINLFYISLIFILSMNIQLCQSKAVPSPEKSAYNEFDTTVDVDVEVGFTTDDSEGFDLYDSTNTIIRDTTGIYIERNPETTSINAPHLKDDENATISVNNSTVTNTELSNFFPENDAENVTVNTNVTGEMELLALTTTDSLSQTETTKFENATQDWISAQPTNDTIYFDIHGFDDYGDNYTVLNEEFFGNISIDSYVGTHVENSTVLQEEFFGNISHDNDTEIAEKEKPLSLYEIFTRDLTLLPMIQAEENDPENDPEMNFAWSDVASRDVGGEEGGGGEEGDPECGIPKSEHHSRKKRVVGGTQTIYGQIPWLVSLRFRGEHEFINQSGFNHLCGANLIHPRWLLTAAHCFDEVMSENENMSNKTFWYAVIGENSLSAQEETQREVEIDKIIVHERFSYPGAIQHDIALVRLSESITETAYTKFICLDRKKRVYPGEICTVVGWGLHAYGGNGSAYPFQTTLKVLSRHQCFRAIQHLSSYYRSIYEHSETTFCANSDNGGDTCHGDSGGPFQCFRNGRWYLTGLTHAGYKCGEAPGVYARIGYFIDWIDDKMKEN